ncbi:VanW family protein [Cytobacillus sp. FJAT-53684]|uniref:VanW family protein n=1 Tax=Cytobacillus mangrovibacter TaxID=3299024 RepID=A0ABW6JYG0_9BACI
MKNTFSLKLYMIVTICTAFIFCFSYLGNSVYGKVFNKSDVFAINTKIGSVEVSNMSQVEALRHLAEEQEKWRNEIKITLQYKEKAIELDTSLYTFQPEKTIENTQQGKENELFVDIDDDALSNFLLEISPELTSADFNIGQLKSGLLIYAARLQQGEHTIKLQEYFLESKEDELVAESTTSLQDSDHSLNTWIKNFPKIEIEPHSQLSILKLLEESGLKTFDQKTLSIVSSTIYKTILSTNFAITERHISRRLPDYAEIGFEAKVDPNKNMDFIITNPNDEKYILQFKYVDNLLYVSLKGSKFIYQYQVILKDKETFKPKKIIQYDGKLSFGEEKIAEKGIEGILIKVDREILDESGNLLRTESVSEDFYPPVHEVIIHSLVVNESTSLNGDNSQDPTVPGEGQANETTDNQVDIPGNSEKNTDSDQNMDPSNNTVGQESDLWGKPNESLK